MYLPIWNWTLLDASGDPNRGLSEHWAALSDTCGSDPLLSTGSAPSSSGDTVPDGAVLKVK